MPKHTSGWSLVRSRWLLWQNSGLSPVGVSCGAAGLRDGDMAPVTARLVPLNRLHQSKLTLDNVQLGVSRISWRDGFYVSRPRLGVRQQQENADDKSLKVCKPSFQPSALCLKSSRSRSILQSFSIRAENQPNCDPTINTTAGIYRNVEFKGKAKHCIRTFLINLFRLQSTLKAETVRIFLKISWY